MNEIEAVLSRLSAGQQNRVRAAYESLQEGLLTSGEFVDVVATTVLVGNSRAYALGAATARALIERQVAAAEVTPAVGPGAHMDETRVREALGTILASEQDTLMQLTRMADSEPKQAASDGSHDVIRSSRRTEGWRRSLNAGACQLCQWLYKAGYVYPADKPMHQHPGCMCSMTPVVKETA